MDISDLKAFVMLAETLNFSRAAEAMYVSQSTFSRQIGRLESELGMPLFVRSPRSVTLTEYGRVFLPEAQAQLDAWELSLRHMEQVRLGKRGSFTLGFIQDHPNDRLPEILRAFRRQCPDVDLNLREYGQTAIAHALEAGEIDAAFTFGEGLYESEQICTSMISTTPICAVLAEDHPLCIRQQTEPGGIFLKELAGQPLVLISRDISFYGYQNVLERCRKGGFSPEIAATANIVPSLFMLVEAGMGFAFLPRSAQRMAPEDICFLRLKDCSDEIATVLAWRRENTNPCLVQFLDAAGLKCASDTAKENRARI